MGEYEIVRGMLLRIGREVSGKAPLARAALGWARQERRWLLGDKKEEGTLAWRELRRRLEAERRTDADTRPLLLAARLADALCFGETDRRILLAAVAVERCPRARALARLLLDQEADLTEWIADHAGIEPHAVGRSQPFRLGLVSLFNRRGGGVEIDIGWTLDRLLDRDAPGSDELLEVVVGPRQHASLGVGDFVGVAAQVDLLVRLLAGGVRERASGINVLIHGPPGTGKTELARTLAAAAGTALYGVGECDEDGNEPSRWERVSALRVANRMLAERGGACLLFDEMEDLIGDAQANEQGGFKGRQGSKLWVNRMLETNPVPVIWTTNVVGNIDPAILRRMSYILHLDTPSRAAGLGIADRIAADEQVALPESLRALIGSAPEATSVLRVAARAGKLAGDAQDIARSAESLVAALRHGRPVRGLDEPVDLDLYECDRDLEALFTRLTAPDAAQDYSLLLTGPPGTGKSGLAHHLARKLDRPLIVKRASDLLSKWVGRTEENIADAFEEAERQGGVLLFDEVDSLLFDRSTAQRSWEVTQVNELLTWLERHPLPFVAATNHAGRLDPAALRRFVFKLDLGPLSRERAARAFARFFDMTAPAELAELANLTAGDFAVVRRQLRFEPGAGAGRIVALLRAEAEAKPGSVGRLGF